MSTEQELETTPVQPVVFQREIEQLPIITEREYAERAFAFLLTTYCTAVTVQLLTFIPLVAPLASRIPFIVLGLALFLAGAFHLHKNTLAKIILTAVILGAIVGL